MKYKLFLLVMLAVLLAACTPAPVVEHLIVLIEPDNAIVDNVPFDVVIPSDFGGHYALWYYPNDYEVFYWQGKETYNDYAVDLLYSPRESTMEVQLSKTIVDGFHLIDAMASLDLNTGELSNLYLLDEGRLGEKAEIDLRDYILSTDLRSLAFNITVEAPKVAKSYYCVH
jgi:hypothetical protein